jgi:hypothetical protein
MHYRLTNFCRNLQISFVNRRKILGDLYGALIEMQKLEIHRNHDNNSTNLTTRNSNATKNRLKI